MRMIVIFHTDDYRVAYYTIIMAVYFTDIIYISCFSQSSHYQSIMSKKIFANDFLHLRISHSCEK